MVRKEMLFRALIILASLARIAYCAEEAEKGGNTTVGIGNNKDVVVRAECIKTSTGSTAGFRVEVINRSEDQNLVLVVRDNISFMFHIRLRNKEGLIISPRLPNLPKYKRGPNTPKTYRYDIILPGTSHAWFIPVPRQARIDPRKPTNENNLQRTPKGNYLAEMRVVIGYFTQDKEEESIPKRPDFQTLSLDIPRISVMVDRKSLTEDIMRAYLDAALITLALPRGTSAQAGPGLTRDDIVALQLHREKQQQSL